MSERKCVVCGWPGEFYDKYGWCWSCRSSYEDQLSAQAGLQVVKYPDRKQVLADLEKQDAATEPEFVIVSLGAPFDAPNANRGGDAFPTEEEIEEKCWDQIWMARAEWMDIRDVLEAQMAEQMRLEGPSPEELATVERMLAEHKAKQEAAWMMGM